MKKCKVTKLIITVLVVFFISVIDVHHPLASRDYFVNYFRVEMTDDEYDTLLNLGFTDEEIYYMEEEEFERNKDLDATLVASATKYYKTVVPMYGLSYSTEVTQQEYFNQGQAHTLDTLTTYYRQEISTIAANGSTKYRYKITTTWLNWPSVASYDVTGIGFTNEVYISSTLPYFTYVYGDQYGNHTSSTVTYDKKKTATGGSATYLMPSNVTSLSSKIYFDVMKNTNDTLTSLVMCGDYAHAGTPVTQTQAANHAINSGGINFDPAVYNYYDDTDCCYSALYGISW